MAPSTLKADFRIHGLDCAEEVKLIRRQLDNTQGLHDLGFDVVRGRMSAEFDPRVLSADAIIQQISKTGLKAEPWQEDEKPKTFFQNWGRWIAAAVSGLSLAIVMTIEGLHPNAHTDFLKEHIHKSPAELIFFALIAIAAGMIYTAPKAWGAFKLMQPDMNVLVLISTVGACYLGEWSEGATLAFLFSLAGVLEVWSISRARGEIGALMKEAPSEATVLHGHGADFHAHCCNKDHDHVHEHRVGVDNVPPGSVVRVRPGEKIPFDGCVASGASGVNEAMITGEFTPVLKQTGDSVLAGTITTDGMLDIRTTTPAADTTLARIIRMVEDSEMRRAPSEQFVERFSRVYTPVMMVLALIVAVVPPLLMPDWTWSRAFYQSMVVLLIACPCALVISTPVTIAAAIASAAKRGVLFKGGAHLETAARLKAIALDKTGVITAGRPEVESVQLYNGHDAVDFLERVAGLETGSEHPLAKAIVRHAERLGVRAATVTDFRALPGRGAEGVIRNQGFWAGSLRYATDRGLRLSADDQPGFTRVFAGSGNEVWGSILLRDQLRPGIREAIHKLGALGIQHITMLTGDGDASAAKVAQEIDMPSYRANLLPSDKAEAIRGMLKQHSLVAMMGDGVNDAQAMASSSLGIAFGPSSSGLAMETADAVVLSEDPERLPFLVAHAKRSLAVIKQNLALALGSKLIFLIVALLGSASLWMAVAADMGATLVVTFNGLRLLRAKE